MPRRPLHRSSCLLLLLQVCWLLHVAPPARGAGEPHVTGYRPPTPAEQAALLRSGAVEEKTYAAPSREALSRWPRKALRTKAGALEYAAPAAIDLAATGFLPPVRNQGSLGSCSTFSTVYYNRGFLECREHGWDPNKPENQMSPAFIFNYLARGEFSYASSIGVPGSALTLMGCASWAEMPYDGLSVRTFPSEKAWRQAPLNRINRCIQLTGTDKAVRIANIKQNLANGLPVTIGMGFGQNLHAYRGGHGDGYDSDVIYSLGDGSVRHAMTIVGYDDAKAYSENGKASAGAFKLVNSWGTTWGLNGFLWLSYSALMSAPYESIALEDRIGYQPKLLARLRLTHPDASMLSVCFARERSGTIDWLACFMDSGRSAVRQWFPGNMPQAFGSASNSALDTSKTMVFDLSDGYDPARPLNEYYLWVQDSGSVKTRLVESWALETSATQLVSRGTPYPTYDPQSVRGPAGTALLSDTQALAVGPDGSLYLIDTHYRVRRIRNGLIEDCAGTGSAGAFSDQPHPALTVPFSDLTDLAVDGAGSLFLLRQSGTCIYLVNAAGEESIVANESRLNSPYGLDLGPGGVIYVANTLSHNVLKIDTLRCETTVIAGTGVAGSAGDEAAATRAQIQFPQDVAYNPINRCLYILEGNSNVRMIDRAGIIHTVYKPVNPKSSMFLPDSNIVCAANGDLVFAGGQFGRTLCRLTLAGELKELAQYPTSAMLGGVAVESDGHALAGGMNVVERLETSGAKTVVAGTPGLSGYSRPVIVRMGPSLPCIMTWPPSQAVTRGARVVLSVDAVSAAPLTYQWKKNGAPISGAQSAMLTIAAARPADAGDYVCEVRSSAGSVASPAARLAVKPVNGVARAEFYR